MGSWNDTCAISNLPIAAGEDVIVMFLLQQPTADRGYVCYPNHYWTPLHSYFEGKYNDYGGVEDCHGVFLDYILESIRDNLYEMEQGENQYHDIPVKKDNFNIETLFEADHSGRLFLASRGAAKSYHRIDKQRLRHIVIRKNVFENIVYQHKVQEYEPMTPEDYDNYKRYHYVDYGVERYIESGNAFFKKLNTNFAAFCKLYEDNVGTKLDIDHEAELYQLCGLEELGHWDRRSEPEYLFARLLMEDKHDRYANLYHLALRQLKDPSYAQYNEHVVKQLSELVWLRVFMMGCNKVWTPTCGGGQEMDTKAQTLLYQVSLAEAERIKRRREEF